MVATRKPTVLMLQDLSSNKLGGTEEYTLAFGRALAARGGRLVNAVRALNDEWRDALHDIGAQVETIPRGIGRVAFGRAVRNLARRVRPDVAIMNFFAPIQPVPRWLKAGRSGARHILFVDDLSGGAAFRSPARALAARTLARFCMAPCDRIIGVSNFVSERDRDRYGLPAHKIRTVYNGVHTRVPSAAEVAAIRADFDLGDKPVVLGLGHFVKSKGFHHLIEAFEGLPQDAILMLVGAPPAGKNAYADRLRSMLQRLPPERVRLVGVRSDARSFMAASDIVVVPSTWQEAFGFVVAEGMMAGAAVVASRAGGIPELIRDGVDGVLVKRASSADLREKLGALLDDPAHMKQLGQTAAEVARERFSVERMAADMLDQIDQVAPGLLTSAHQPPG